MKPFPIYNEDSAPEESQSILSDVKNDFGMIPNLEGVMSEAPALLASYTHNWAAFQTSSLSAIEQQVVYMTVNVENNCEYCVPWHTKLSELAFIPKAEIENLRQGGALADDRLNTLHQFTKTIVRTKGAIASADLNAFLSAGFAEKQALEVVLGVAIKVMSNYTNALAQTPLDDVVEPYRWTKASLRHS